MKLEYRRFKEVKRKDRKLGATFSKSMGM